MPKSVQSRRNLNLIVMETEFKKFASIESIILNDDEMLLVYGGGSEIIECGFGCGLGCGSGCGARCLGCTEPEPEKPIDPGPIYT